MILKSNTLSILILSLLTIVFSLSASAENPVVTSHYYVMGPYNISFDLLGIRDLEPSIREPEEFQARISDGIRYDLILEDKNSDESIEIQILKYNNPIAKDASNSADYESANYLAEGAYGPWFVYSDMFSGLTTRQAVGNYTLCHVTSTMSWRTTERLLETLHVNSA
jgi:hypothetical protein